MVGRPLSRHQAVGAIAMTTDTTARALVDELHQMVLGADHRADEAYYTQAAKTIESLADRVRDLEAALRDAIEAAERFGPVPAHDGSCGPWSSCDGQCVDSHYHHEMVQGWRKLAALTPRQEPTP